MALVLAFLLAEKENRQLEDLPLADFGRLPHSLVSYRVTHSKRNFISTRAHVLFSHNEKNAESHTEASS